MKEIWDRLKVDFEYYTGASYVGFVKAIGAGFSSRLSEFYGKLKFIEKQAFIETADRDYLFLHSGCLVDPNGAESAEGLIVFYGQLGAEVPVGVELSYNGIEYITADSSVVSEYQISGVVSVVGGVAYMNTDAAITSCQGLVNGASKQINAQLGVISFDAEGLGDGETVSVIVNKTGSVSVRAVKKGLEGNRAYNDTLKTKVTIQGLNREAGVVVISGGRDEESLDEYRERVKGFMANPQAPFNENNIRSVLLEMIPTLKKVWVKSSGLGDGVAKVFAINQNYGLTEKESERIIGLVRGIKPIHVKDEDILAAMPTIKKIDVVITGLLPDTERMRDQIRKNIEYLFSVDMFERGMSHDEIESMVYRTEIDGERVQRFEIVSGFFDAEKDTLYRLNSVVFN